MQRSRMLRYTPIGFVDDDPRKRGMRMSGGLKVLGSTKQIATILDDDTATLWDIDDAASARNLHWWTKYTGLDPENQLGGTGGAADFLRGAARCGSEPGRLRSSICSRTRCARSRRAT